MPDDVVDVVASMYNTPTLAYYHLKEKDSLGNKYLPDVITLETIGDMGFQLYVARDEFETYLLKVTKIISVGEPTQENINEFEIAINGIKQMLTRAMSAILYAEKVMGR